MKTRGWVITGVVTAATVALGLEVVASDTLLLAGGSDALAAVAAPQRWAQLLAAALAGLAVALQARRKHNTPGLLRRLAIPASLILVLLAGHRMVLDGARGELRDVYWLMTVQRVAFDVADGSTASYSAQISPLFLRLQANDTAQVTTIFLGPPPWRVPARRLTPLWP